MKEAELLDKLIETWKELRSARPFPKEFRAEPYVIDIMNEIIAEKKRLMVRPRCPGKAIAEEYYVGHFKKIPIYGRNMKFSIVDDPLNFECRQEKTENLIKQAVKDMIEARRKND